MTVAVDNGAAALIERVIPRVRNDPILADFRGSRPARLGGDAVEPSGVDLVACAIARSVLPEAAATTALVLPRARHGLPVLLGAYLTRWHRSRGYPGSVAVVSRSTRLREQARTLRVPDGALGTSVPLARLAAFPDPGGRLRAAAMPFGSDERRGLSQNHRYLLFQRPNVAPLLAQNVVSTVVVDATDSSQGAWEQLYERHAGRRRQVWVGELGNAEFESFCAAHSIPLFRFDWETIAAAANQLGVGRGPFTTAALCERAATLPAPGLRLCCHGEFDDELRELSRRLALIHEIARDEEADVPEPVRQAMRLNMLFRRLACPVATYDEQAARSPFVRASAALLRAVEDAPRAAFRNRWKRAYDSHWGAVKGSARRLRQLAGEECPKWWAVTDRVFEARDRGELLRLVCQTKAEQAALTRSLVDQRVIEAGDLGTVVDVVTFADRLPPGEDARIVTVYTAPLPPWRAAAYLSAESGRIEVLCYATERRALASGLEHAWQAAAGVEGNQALLDAFGFAATASGNGAGAPVAVPEIVELEPFTFDGSTGGGADEQVEQTDRVKEFWQRAVDLYGQDVELTESIATANGDAVAPRGPVAARLVVFADGSAVYLDETVDYDVVVGGGKDAPARVKPMPPRRLAAGMRLALLPGAARGSLVHELMSAWDERLKAAPLYDGLWRTAMAATAERLGVQAIAQRLGITAQTVEIWLSGEGWPQQRRWMVDVLEQSGNETAWENRAAIIHHIRHTRGMHRLIGRVLNDAVAETVVSGEGRATRKLEQIVDQDLSDLFSAVRVMVIASVSEPEQVAAARIGEFTDDVPAPARGAA